MVVIDELSISDGDMEEIQNNGGETSEIKRILDWLSVNTKMTLAALSSSSLLDREEERNKDNKDNKEIDFEWLPGFQTVNLKNIMRTSQNIAEATSVESCYYTWKDSNNQFIWSIEPRIDPGTSSTVPGKRPRLMIYSRTVLSDIKKYNKLADYVSQHLKTLPTEKMTVAVLCDPYISARQLSDQLRTREESWAVSTYDGGVEEFNYFGAPEYREDSGEDGGRAELTEWLRAESGILVTHAHQYRGCEADAVILVSRDWGGDGYYDDYVNIRSPAARAVCSLAVITSDLGLTDQERISSMQEHWDVERID